MGMEAEAAPETGAESDDVRASVVEAMQSLKEPEIAAAGEVDETAKADRPRNERGQFIKADGSVDTEAEAARVTDADPAQANVVQSSPAVDAPKSWSAEAKAEFGKLSPAVQQAVLKREGEISSGGAQWSEEKRRYEEALSPVRAVARANGVDEATTINRLVAANDYLERDPVNAIRWLAQAYGVDLSKEPSNPSPQPVADPMVAQLHQDVTSLKTHIERQQQAETMSALDKFKAEPGHEHFEAVKVKMGKLMLAGEATTLQEAYDQAIWASQDIRTQLLAAQTAPQEAQRKQREQTDRARRGAISINGSPSAGATIAPKRDFETHEDAARAAFELHRGAA